MQLKNNREFDKWTKAYKNNFWIKNKIKKIDFNDSEIPFFKSFINTNSPLLIAKSDIGYNNFNKVSLYILATVISDILKTKQISEEVFVFIGHDGHRGLKKLALSLVNSFGYHKIQATIYNDDAKISKSLFDYTSQKIKSYYNFYFRKIPNSKYICLEIKNSKNEFPIPQVLEYLEKEYHRNKFNDFHSKETIVWKINLETIWQDFQNELFNKKTIRYNDAKVLKVAVSSKNKKLRKNLEKMIGNFDIEYIKSWNIIFGFPLLKKIFLAYFKKVDLLIDYDKSSHLPIFYIKNKKTYKKISFLEMVLILFHYNIDKNPKKEIFKIEYDFIKLSFLEQIAQRNNIPFEHNLNFSNKEDFHFRFFFNELGEIHFSNFQNESYNIFFLIMSMIEFFNYQKTQNFNFVKIKDHLSKIYDYPIDWEKEFLSKNNFKTIIENLLNKGFEVEKAENKIFSFFDSRIKFKNKNNIEFFLFVNTNLNYYKIFLKTKDNSVNLSKAGKILYKELK